LHEWVRFTTLSISIKLLLEKVVDCRVEIKGKPWRLLDTDSPVKVKTSWAPFELLELRAGQPIGCCSRRIK
jgi:hypothetical protein